MKHKFEFNAKTGTMEPVSPAVAQGIKTNVKADVEQKVNVDAHIPEFTEEKKIEIKSDKINIQNTQIVQMKRMDKPTAVQLVDENGVPEAYLDSITTGVMMFRERQDYDIYQVVDQRSGKPLAYIGGYALQINFNMAELNTMEKIEQCLQGLTKLFRHAIMNQPIK